MRDLLLDLPAYRAIVASRVRAQRVYGVSFAADTAGSVLVGLVEFAEVWVVFHNVRSLGGMTFAQVLLLFGITHTGYAASQVVVGHVDRIPLYVRQGTVDVFCVRPLSLLGQLVTSALELRRIGWFAVGLGALAAGIALNDIAWDPTSGLLLLTSLACATAFFGAIFVWAAALQFFLVDGQEMTNAFTYGGRYASQQPSSIMPVPLLVLFVAVVPVAFTGYLPALALLDLPTAADVPWLRPELAWAGPLVAAWTWLVAALLWRVGTRHYQGGGG